MQTVVETPTYLRAAERLFSEAERAHIVDMLATEPWSGDEIPGSGGVRKVRVGASGRGKRGGARVVYFVYSEAFPVILLTCYGKNERANLSAVEINAFAKLTAALKTIYRKAR